MICWSCDKPVGDGLLCAACGVVQAPDAKANHFQVIGVERRFEMDRGDLEKRYKDLTRVLHPDRWVRADAQARRFSLSRSVQLNDAWRTLRDPVRRAEYLLKLDGIDIAEDRAVPPALLMEVMEMREGLAEARGDRARVEAMAAAVRARRDQELGAVTAGFASGDVNAVSGALVKIRYFDRFLEEAEADHAA